jgi:hypothetical protein
MPIFNPSSIKGKAVGKRPINGKGYGSFLLGNTLGGLQEAEGIDSAYAGKGLGMGMKGMSSCGGSGLSSINKKLESLMVKASKPKPKNIKFSM